MNNEILEKANNLIEAAKTNKLSLANKCEYFHKCLNAGICPECGSELKLISEPYIINTGCWIFKRSHNRFILKVICTNGHKLLSPYDGSDRGYPGNCEFDDCANSEINYANKQDSYDDDEMDDHPGW